MSLDNITALVWIFVAGYALSVFQSIKRTSDFVKTEVQKMCEEENRLKHSCLTKEKNGRQSRP